VDGKLGVFKLYSTASVKPSLLLPSQVYVIAGIAIARCFRGFFSLVSGGFCCAGAPARELQFNPPFCGNYALPLDASKKHRLTKFEQNSGWIIVRDSRGLILKIRKWQFTGVTFGLPHTAGQR
jgi:hypothetical protein